MRELTDSETLILENRGEADDGFIGVQTTVQELADLNAGTACGTVGNHCFEGLAKAGYGNRIVFCWFDEINCEVAGLVNIECDEVEAVNVSVIAKNNGGCLWYEDTVLVDVNVAKTTFSTFEVE